MAGPFNFKPGNAFAAAKMTVPLEQAWRRCAIAFLVAFFAGLGSVYTFLLVVDPYDTGRFPTPLPPGVDDNEMRTAVASRGRDPRFNAAIFGNSRAQLLNPAKLSEATGLSFVQLVTPGSGPKEQMTLMRYFLRHHPGPQAIVFSIDERWCGHDPSLPVTLTFPFWLYRGDLEYLANLLSTRAFVNAQRRIKVAMGLLPPTDPRGYDDYETGHVRNFHPPALSHSGPAVTATPNTYFPALEAFDVLLAQLPLQTRFVIMMPPIYHTALPGPGTQAAADLSACKAELARRLGRQGSAFLDYLVDGPISRDPENFMDVVHYRLNVARLIEDRIAAALDGGTRRGGAGR